MEGFPRIRVATSFSGGTASPELRERLEPLLGPGMTVERAAKSAAVRLPVPPMDWTADFRPQEPAARQAVQAAARLLAWGIQHQGRIPWK